MQIAQKQPDISLIIPVYNGEKYLFECLQSVLKQTHKNWEALCINDGSRDNSLSVLQVMAAKDRRFVIINKKNEGVAITRNRGLELARGKYIMFLDQDDFLHPQCFELALKAITEANADICQFNFPEITQTQTVDFAKYDMQNLPLEVQENPLLPYVLGKWSKTGMLWDKIYRAEVAKQVKVRNIQPCEDNLYTFEILDYVHRFAKLNLDLLYYRRNDSSVSLNTAREKYQQIKLKAMDYLAQIVEELCQRHNGDAEFKRILRRFLTEKRLFKEFVLRPLREKYSNTKTKKHLDAFYRMLERGTADYELLRLRYRIIYRLASKRHYKTARLVAKL